MEGLLRETDDGTPQIGIEPELPKFKFNKSRGHENTEVGLALTHASPIRRGERERDKTHLMAHPKFFSLIFLYAYIVSV